MVETTSHLMEEYSSELGYTQSDEITLVFLPKIVKNSKKSEGEEKEEEYREFLFAN